MISEIAVTGYVNGSADQFEYNYDADSNVKRNFYYATFHVRDSEENRKEFNRRFNAIIEYHSKLHRDATPEERTDRGYYHWRYFSFYLDIMKLLELFPDAAPDDYTAVVQAVKSYRDKNFYGKWRKWPEHHERR